MEYHFQITPMNTEYLIPQVSRMLERRVELDSREQCPGLWKITDRLRSTPRIAESASKKRRKHIKIWGVVLLVLGIILFVPGCMAPRDLSLLLPGVLGIAAGLISLFGRRGQKRNPFDEQARQLLAGKDQIPKGQSAIFSPEGILLDGGVSNGNVRQISIPYNEVQCVFECEDIFAAVYGQQAVVLQKKDLTTGDFDDFRSFLSQNTAWERCALNDTVY